MSNNFRKTAVLKKKKKKNRAVAVLKFLQTLPLDCPYISVQFFSGA